MLSATAHFSTAIAISNLFSKDQSNSRSLKSTLERYLLWQYNKGVYDLKTFFFLEIIDDGSYTR